MSQNTNGTLNTVRLIGFLGANPELRYTGNGTAVVSLRLATNRRVGEKDVVDWHRVTVWGKQAENAARFLSKGRKVMVEGQLQTRSYESNGQTRYVTEVHTTGFSFMDSPKKEEQAAVEENTGSDKPMEPTQDDLPNF
jgi:single-strand DNA-binding protein